MYKPTMNLRFVSRKVKVPFDRGAYGDNVTHEVIKQILQQQWFAELNNTYEWRDVPLETK